MGSHPKKFGKYSRTALFPDINGGGAESRMEAECRRELSIEDWGVGIGLGSEGAWFKFVSWGRGLSLRVCLDYMALST